MNTAKFVRKGNQVKILSDPVTVTEECVLIIPLYFCMRRGEQTMILKPGNLLCMARLSFRVKYIPILFFNSNDRVMSAFDEAGIFYGISLFV